VEAYVNTLNDPFTYPPVHLGFGTLTDTALSTAYYRASIAANADGTIAFYLAPQLAISTGTTFATNNAGAGVATWNKNTGTTIWPNYAALLNLYATARVISGGMRCYPQIPGTYAPGLALAGSIPEVTMTQIGAQTPTTLLNQPFLIGGLAANGCEAKIHPSDLESYVMSSFVVNGYADNTYGASSGPVISFSGLSPSCPIYYELVLNLEGDYDVNSDAATYLGPVLGDLATDTLATHFPSIESVWALIAPRLKRSGCIFTEPTQHSAEAHARPHRSGMRRSSTMMASSSSSSSTRTSSSHANPDVNTQIQERDDYFTVPSMSSTLLTQSHPPPPTLALHRRLTQQQLDPRA